MLAVSAKMKTLEEQHTDYQRHIAVLKESLAAKEEHYNMLQADVFFLLFLANFPLQNRVAGRRIALAVGRKEPDDRQKDAGSPPGLPGPQQGFHGGPRAQGPHGHQGQKDQRPSEKGNFLHFFM